MRARKKIGEQEVGNEKGREEMTNDEREKLISAIQCLGEAAEQSGDDRDVATAGCLYGVCLAIREGAEVKLARHILTLDGEPEQELIDAGV